MRRYLLSMGRALYSRTKPQSKPLSPLADPNIVPSPLPTPPDSRRDSESITDLIKWHCIRIALKTLQPEPRRQEKSQSPVLDLKNMFSPRMDLNSSSSGGAAATRDPHTKSESHEDFEQRGFHASTFDQLFATSSRAEHRSYNKVTVVGASDVGMATVFSLLAKGVTNDISMIDFSEDKLKGELMDLQSGSKFLRNARLRAGKDYEITTDSKICILTPCSETAPGDKSHDCVRCNAEVLKSVVPQLLRYSPNCVFLVAVDPVDVLSYVTWRVSDLPKGRVLGSGTNLSTATFRYLLSDRLGLSPAACNGFIIGENGESSVPVWSGVSAGGVLLRDLNPEIGTDVDPENWQEIHRQVVQSGQEVRDLKGCHSWAAALSITDICSAILRDANAVRPLSTYVKGEHNIDEEVFMSLPCVVGAAGVTDIIRQPLTCHEMELLRKSAATVAENMDVVKLTQ